MEMFSHVTVISWMLLDVLHNQKIFQTETRMKVQAVWLRGPMAASGLHQSHLGMFLAGRCSEDRREGRLSTKWYELQVMDFASRT